MTLVPSFMEPRVVKPIEGADADAIPSGTMLPTYPKIHRPARLEDSGLS